MAQPPVPTPRPPAARLRRWRWPVLLLMLLGTFAWYFRGDLMVDVSLWWAACFGP